MVERQLSTGYIAKNAVNWDMKIALQYVNDINGKTQAVQLSLMEWEKVLNKLKKYEQTLKIRSNLKEALDQVAVLRKQKIQK